MINRKGEIGETLTWIVALVIVAFVMSIFLSATLLIVGGKNLPVVSWFIGAGSNKAEVFSAESPGNYFSRMERNFFEREVEFEGRKMLIKDLVYLGSDEATKKIGEEFNSFKDGLKTKPSCYALVLDKDVLSANFLLFGGLSNLEKIRPTIINRDRKAYLYFGGWC